MSAEEHIEKEAGSFKLIMTLSVAGFISGLILVSIYLFTKPIIAQNKADALKAAVFEVLPNTHHFKTLQWDGSKLIELADANAGDGERIYLGMDSVGLFTGFAIAGEETGYQDIISAIAGYNPEDRIIIGLKVLDSKETPGLGDKILFDNDFKANFKALAVDPEIVVVKKGEKKADNEIQAITGATISSKAIGRLLDNAMKLWKDRIDQYLKENNGSAE